MRLSTESHLVPAFLSMVQSSVFDNFFNRWVVLLIADKTQKHFNKRKILYLVCFSLLCNTLTNAAEGRMALFQQAPESPVYHDRESSIMKRLITLDPVSK